MAERNATPRTGRGTRGADDEALLTAWTAVLRTSTRVMREFERRFDAEHRVSLREFDVLINLDDAPPEGLRMTELAARTMLSSGGLTRLAGRLEERGLMARTQDPDDARAFRARLTERGARVLAEMRVTHDDAVRDEFGARLAAGDLATLRAILERAAPAGLTYMP